MTLTTKFEKDGGGGGEGDQKWFLELSQALPGSLKESKKKNPNFQKYFLLFSFLNWAWVTLGMYQAIFFWARPRNMSAL